MKNFIVTRNPGFYTPLLVALPEYRNGLIEKANTPVVPTTHVGKGKNTGIGDVFAQGSEGTNVKTILFKSGRMENGMDTTFDFKCITLEDGLRFIQKNEIFATDSETTGLNWLVDEMFCLQLSDGNYNIIFDFQTHGKEKEISANEVVPFLNEKILIFHNGAFDINFYMKHGYVPKPGFVRDTMIQSRILTNQKRVKHAFGDIMERYLGVTYDKSEQKNINKTQLKSLKAIHYSFNDVDRLIELHEKMSQLLINRGQYETYRVEYRHLAAMEYMEQFGIPISAKRWASKMKKDAARKVAAERAVIDYIYDHLPKYRKGAVQGSLFSTDEIGKSVTVSLTSIPQMLKVFQNLGINTKGKDGKTGDIKDMINKKHIERIDHPFIRLWLDLSKENHKDSTFGDNILRQIQKNIALQSSEPDTIYTTFKPMVDTGRIAAGGGGGTGRSKFSRLNALNLERDEETRGCFLAWEGWQMIACDFVGQENVILADKSHCPVMLEAATQGLDLHCAFARLVFPELEALSDDEISKYHKDKRNMVKAPRFAFAYGAGASTVAAASGLPLKLCKKLYKIFTEDLHGRVFEWGREVLKTALECGYIESVNGFRLMLPDFERYIQMQLKWKSLPKDVLTAFHHVRSQKYEIKSAESAIEELKERFETQEPDDEGVVLTKIAYNAEVNALLKLKADIVIKEEEEDVFNEWAKFFKKMKDYEADYRKLCLNNPIQSTGSRMTKNAVTSIYETILSGGHYGKAFIVVAPYDEIVMCVVDELAEYYKDVLESAMRTEANKILSYPELEMKADAFTGDCWESAKSGKHYEFKY